MTRGKSRESLELVDVAYKVLSEIHPATVRAVCYKLFVTGLIDSMSKANTNRVSRQLVWAREEGRIPWEWIVDEHREAERPGTWRDPEAFAEVVTRSYRRDRWDQQPRLVEVWSEKGTVRGMLAPVLHAYAVTFRVMHGYSSATTLNEIAGDSLSDRRPWVVLYIGDCDPSGLHMSEEDLPARIGRYGGRVMLRRIALTEADCTENLPSFPGATKRRDPRFAWWALRYGARLRNQCWEVDALDPRELRSRVECAIAEQIEPVAWERCERVERAERESLARVMRLWDFTKQSVASIDLPEEVR